MGESYHKDENSNDFDWNQIVTKTVETANGSEIGKVDGLEDLDFVVKDGLINPKYYRIPRDKVESYRDGKVRLLLSEEQVKAEFEKSNPGYYRPHLDPDRPQADNSNSRRASNTLS
jgi:hypothetical protein